MYPKLIDFNFCAITTTYHRFDIVYELGLSISIQWAALDTAMYNFFCLSYIFLAYIDFLAPTISKEEPIFFIGSLFFSAGVLCFSAYFSFVPSGRQGPFINDVPFLGDRNHEFGKKWKSQTRLASKWQVMSLLQ